MADTPTPKPVEPIPDKPRAPRSPQDQADANLINTYRSRLTAAQGHPDLVALMQPRGYDAAGLLDGLKGCDLAQLTFNARQLALDTKGTASKVFKTADSGGGTGGGYALSGTIGQSEARALSGGGYTLNSGFWMDEIGNYCVCLHTGDRDVFVAPLFFRRCQCVRDGLL